MSELEEDDVITERMTAGDLVTGWAEFSPTRSHRFTLGRLLDFGLGGARMYPRCCFIMLNPSTADAFKLDPTVKRCAAFAKRWGYGTLEVVNLFALRTPKPSVLRGASNRYHYQLFNLGRIRMVAQRAQLVICAWGADPIARETATAVNELLAMHGVRTHALLQNPDGSPRHPLARGRNRVPEHVEPIPWG